jgi:hypothetical protein
MDFTWWDENLLASVRSMIPQIEGKSCVNVDMSEGTVFVCRRVSGITVDETSVFGDCEWVEPYEVRPAEMGNGFLISHDCLEVGTEWWMDTYFGWYYVFDPALVARSQSGDNTWVRAFLNSVRPPGLDASQQQSTETDAAPDTL